MINAPQMNPEFGFPMQMQTQVPQTIPGPGFPVQMQTKGPQFRFQIRSAKCSPYLLILRLLKMVKYVYFIHRFSIYCIKMDYCSIKEYFLS